MVISLHSLFFPEGTQDVLGMSMIIVPIKEINLIIIEFICNIFVILMKYGELSRPCVDIMLGGLLYIPSFNLASPTCSVEMDFSGAVETNVVNHT